MLTFVSGVIYENQSIDKSMEIRKLVTSKEKRIAPEGFLQRHCKPYRCQIGMKLE